MSLSHFEVIPPLPNPVVAIAISNEGNPRDPQGAPLQRRGVREPSRENGPMAKDKGGTAGKRASRSPAADVIELSDSDSDSDGRARRRRSSSDASPSRHMRKPTEWAFLESPSASSHDDSDDSEARKPAKNAKGKAKSAPVKSKSKKPKKRSFSEEEIDERPRRVAQRHLFSDHLTVSELQAQEREFSRLQRLSQKQKEASPKPKPATNAAPRTVESRSPKPKPTTSVVRTVLATTLARKQQPAKSRDQSPPKKKATKRRLDESEEEEEEEVEDGSDDFEDDFVEAKKAALRASLALTKKPAATNPTAAKLVCKKTTLSRPRSPSPSPPPTPPRSRASEPKKDKHQKKPAPAKPGKAKKPEKKQPKPTHPTQVDEPRRKRNEKGLLSDWLSVSELQAQEREWSRLQRDLNFIKSTTPETNTKTQPPRHDRPSRATRRGRVDSVSSSDMSLVEIIQLIEEDEDDDSKKDGDFVLQLDAPPSKKSSNKGSKSKKRGGIQSKSSTPSAPKSTSNGKPMELLAKPRTATDTVPHWTTWRGVKFGSAPANLLLLPSSLLPPFVSNADKPLVEFDSSGELDTKCQLLASFGKTKTFLLSNDASKPELSQEAMNDRVMELLETWTPQIKGCYGRKSEAILREARERVQEYVRLRDEHYQSILKHAVRRDPRVQYEKLPVCKAELAMAKQLQLSKAVSPLDVMGTIKIGRGESFLVEKDTIAETALELASVRPISRSTTYTGIKASVRVEDDPILRYVPYFGDNDDGDAIDVKAYEAIQAKQAAEGAKSSNGLDNEAHEYMLRLVIAECGDQETVFNALKQVAGFAQPYTEYMEIKKRRESRNNARKRIDETKGFLTGAQQPVVEDEEPTRKAIQVLTSGLHPFASDSRRDVPLTERFAPQWTYFDTNLLPSQTRTSKGFRPLLGLRLTTDYGDLSETFRDLFCRMCYTYDCHDHGIEHPMPTRRVDPLYPTTRFAPVVTNGASAEIGKDEVEGETGSDKLSGEPASVSTGTDESVEGDAEEIVLTTQATDLTDLASESSATTAESQEMIDLSASEPRRSSRSGTRASTLATISVESQWAAQGFKPRNHRQRPKAPPKRTNGDVSEYLDDSHFPLISTKVKSFVKAGETCGTTCWKAKHDATEESAEPLTGTDAFNEPEDEIKAKLNSAELLVLQKLRYTVGDNACMIATVLQSSLSCRDIHAYLVSQQRSKPVDEQGYFSPEVSGKKNRKRGRATAALPGNNRELLKRTRHQRLKDTSSANHDYEPCNHEGICDFGASCSCMKRDHMCEKACSCSRDCPNRFQGCKCSMGNCRTNQCPCFVALRECNPDLCGSCGASDVPVLVYNPEYKNVSSQDLGICCNVNAQRGLHKHIGVSYSRTHGWGAFALEPIKRGEFIYEYVGAIISHDEAERRGTIYDKLNISFLFDLNEDSVADAIRTGNKSKFCNHANVGQKCHARIFRVGGEHHISIWANADIQKGEELFFNYGYHGESAPVWSQGARITESSKREAAAAADELQE